MSNIASSTVRQESHAQSDGRVLTFEVHTDTQGVVHEESYLAEIGANINAILAQHAADWDAKLTNDELAKNISEVIDVDI